MPFHFYRAETDFAKVAELALSHPRYLDGTLIAHDCKGKAWLFPHSRPEGRGDHLLTKI